EYECIVIGGGIGGCAVAFALSKQFNNVLLIERDWKEPDRIVGELLQPGGVKALQELGLEDVLEGIDAIPVHGYVVVRNKTQQQVQLPYPFIDNMPKEGRSFHHGKLIMKLREAAASQKNVICLEATVNQLIIDSAETVTGAIVSSKGIEKKIKAPLTIVTDGCFSKFRKIFTKTTPKLKSHFAGLLIDPQLRLVLNDVVLPIPNHGNVILANPSPILLYQIGTHDTRILVDIPGKLPSQTTSAMKDYMNEFVCPQLPKQVQSSFLTAIETQTLRIMPNSWLPPTRQNVRGAILLGDALNMRHPLTGGGMTVALWDVVWLVRLLQGVNVREDPSLVGKVMKRHFIERRNVAIVVNMLAMMLYSLFSAGD
ncbi:Squalene epoxidase, partial [Nowakowskiella sp. JEL0078]